MHEYSFSWWLVKSIHEVMTIQRWPLLSLLLKIFCPWNIRIKIITHRELLCIPIRPKKFENLLELIKYLETFVDNASKYILNKNILNIIMLLEIVE